VGIESSNKNKIIIAAAMVVVAVMVTQLLFLERQSTLDAILLWCNYSRYGDSIIF